MAIKIAQAVRNSRQKIVFIDLAFFQPYIHPSLLFAVTDM